MSNIIKLASKIKRRKEDGLETEVLENDLYDELVKEFSKVKVKITYTLTFDEYDDFTYYLESLIDDPMCDYESMLEREVNEYTSEYIYNLTPEIEFTYGDQR